MRFPALPLLISSLFLIGLSIPLVLQKIPPNGWYGFRTEKTLSDPSIWYSANKLGGKYFLVVGVFQLAAWLFIVSTPSLPVTAFLLGRIVFLVSVPLLAAILLWWTQVRKM